MVFALAFTGPLGFLLLLLMIAGTASVLLGEDPLPQLLWTAPAAIALAFAFTLHRLRSLDAELVVLGDRAAMRSVWEVVWRKPAILETMTPPRRVRDGLDLGIGRTVHTLTSDDWPELNRINEILTEIVPAARPDVW